MKTLVEFFDNEPLKNIFATIIYQLEKVILVYDYEWVDELKKKGALRLIKKKNPRAVVKECGGYYQHYEGVQDTL